MKSSIETAMKIIRKIWKGIKVGFDCMSNLLLWIVIGIPCAILISLGIAIAMMQGRTIDEIKLLFIDELNRSIRNDSSNSSK